MLPVPLATSNGLSPKNFWQVVMLYHTRPFLINRLITATSQALFHKIIFKSTAVNHVSELFTKSAISNEMRRVKVFSKSSITSDFIRNILECYDEKLTILPSSEDLFLEEVEGIFISVRILLSKVNITHRCLEVVVLDKDKNSAYFVAVSEPSETRISPPFPYELELNSTNFRINIEKFEDAESAHADWLADKLFPKLLKWSDHDSAPAQRVNTLSLVPVDEYCLLYNKLKQKYAENLVKDWLTKTKTDPQKYIFEDIAIATYLILLWKQYPSSSINFVDCGCGNGLLVYLLNQEGFNGYGIDVRRRPVWDIYPSETKLEVGTVTPTSLFPDSTWLIGNHSDELTPWLPVISLKSSRNTHFFVLPCCPFDFSGQKYIRTNTSISAYSDYLLYIEKICKRCGFETHLDKLRIPSTKKTCLVGYRTQSGNLDSLISEVDEFIERRMSTKFTPRSDIEPVRNCTQLNRQFITNLVKTCVNFLLAAEGNILTKSDGHTWNKGSTMSIANISRKLPLEDLQELKKQCGGLQTLFRNHRYLFVVDRGNVSVRMPANLQIDGDRYKKKPCWFYKNHPDGCYYSDDACGFEHSVDCC